MNEPNPATKLCECGCGQPAPMAIANSKKSGAIKGQPQRFVHGHAGRKHLWPDGTPQARGGMKRRIVTFAVGDRFGRGVVVEADVQVPQPNGKSRRGARMLCDCGTEYLTLADRLANGDSQSCGCQRLANRKAANTRHGMVGHPLYKTWDGMIGRCERPNDVSYKDYGGRGIKVCERWHDPRLFIADIENLLGPRPPDHTLDRYPDNNGNYEPGNVRWATWEQQAANRRPAQGVGERTRQQLLRQSWRTEVCDQCGDEYQTRSMRRDNQFCSKKCKAKHRRDSGVDDVNLVCHQCGGSFTANRYDKTRHCSQSCAATCQHAGGCPR